VRDMIYTVRTTSGRETIVIDMLETKVKAEKLKIKTIFHPAEIKGYIFIEGSPGEVQKAIRGVMHVRGLIEKPVRLEEIQQFLEQKKEIVKVGMGDTVEIIGGPFKGEKGKINRVDPVKREVTVELLEATIPIPVTIATEFIKVIKIAKKEGEAKEVVEEKPKEEEPSVFEGFGEEEEKPELEAKPEEAAMEEAKEPEAALPEEPEPVEEPRPEPAAEEEPAEGKPETPEEKAEDLLPPEPEKPPTEEPVPEPKPVEEPEAAPEEKPTEPPEEGEENPLIAELEKSKEKKKKSEDYDEED